MQKSKQSAASRVARPLLLVLLVVLSFGLYTQRFTVLDWWRLRKYVAPVSIQQLAAQDTMTPYTRHLLYLNQPELLNTVTNFRKHCPENKDTIVLGCYHPDENGIYVYNIKDASLAGVTQVTAAHEVLHAVYTRLSSGDRRSLNAMLQQYYDHGLADQRVKDEIAIYKKTEPKAVLDEMHSTFGTEIATLPANLEAYYTKYFTDRHKIVAFGAQYQAAFTGRQQQIKDDDAKLTTMKQQIASERANVQTLGNEIDSRRGHLDDLLNAGKTTDYNAAVPGFNAEVSSYNATLAKLQSDIDAYNQLVNTRNGIAGQLTTLAGALDTRVPDKKSK